MSSWQRARASSRGKGSVVTGDITILLLRFFEAGTHRLQEGPYEPRDLVQVRQVFNPAARHMLDGPAPLSRRVFDLPVFEPHPNNIGDGIVFE